MLYCIGFDDGGLRPEVHHSLSTVVPEEADELDIPSVFRGVSIHGYGRISLKP